MRTSASSRCSTPDRPLDKNNIQPRLGFAYSVNDRTVMRGGWGLFYGGGTGVCSHALLHEPQIDQRAGDNNDGRPDFASNPFNGPIPTYEQAGLQKSGRAAFARILTSFADRPRADSVHAPGVDRRAAAVRQHHVGRGRPCVQPTSARR